MSKVYYHYCSLETLIHIISSKKIRLCNVSKMNDEYECLNLDDFLVKVIKDRNLDKTNPEIIKLSDVYLEYKYDRHMPYVSCFSEDKDRLSQWRAYANDGQGVSIGFDFDKLENIIENSPTLIKSTMQPLGYSKVIYKDEEKKALLNNLIDKYIDEFNVIRYDDKKIKILNDEYSNTLLKYTTLFKNEAFIEESEQRIIYLPLTKWMKRINAIYNFSEFKKLDKGFYSKANTIIGFYEYPFNSDVISEIVLGPKCKLDEEDIDLKNLLEHYDIKANISKSKASYR